MKLRDIYSRSSGPQKGSYTKSPNTLNQAPRFKKIHGPQEEEPTIVQQKIKIKPINEEEPHALISLLANYPRPTNLPLKHSIIHLTDKPDFTPLMSPEEWEDALLQTPDPVDHQEWQEELSEEGSGLQQSNILAYRGNPYGFTKPKPKDEYQFPEEDPEELERKAQERLAQTEAELEESGHTFSFSFAPEINRDFWGVTVKNQMDNLRKSKTDDEIEPELQDLLEPDDHNYGLRGPLPNKLYFNDTQPFARGTYRDKVY